MSGGPVFMRSEKTGGIHAYSVFSAKNPSKPYDYATRLRKPLFDDLIKIKNGETDSIDYFLPFSLTAPSVSRINVRNKCDRPLIIGFKYIHPEQDRWITKGFFKIAARTTVNPVITIKGRKYYYFAKTLDNEDVWRGDHDRGSMRRMGDDGFRKRSLEYDGDRQLTLNCD